MTAEKPNCKGCFFSVLSEPDPNTLQRQLYCYHSPPQVFPMFQTTPQGVATLPATAFPGVNNDNWCHQFQPKNPMAIVDKQYTGYYGNQY